MRYQKSDITRNVPTQTGYYWTRITPRNAWRLCEVLVDDAGQANGKLLATERRVAAEIEDLQLLEWVGPIKQPME